MTDRGSKIADFLRLSGWSSAARKSLAGDASSRRYERLTMGDRGAVLMDAPPEKGESIERFSRMARWLRASGFSAPDILAEDNAQGLLLLEDMGDALFARLTSASPDRETELYSAATDFLTVLHRCPPPDFLMPLDGLALAQLVQEVLGWYLVGTGDLPGAGTASIPALVHSEFDRLRFCTPVVSLRDFHAENLIWLPERKDHARVGLLDFQDAVLADPAYDLVSLLQDARRDVSSATETDMIARYCATTNLPEGQFRAVYAFLGVQRALRIIGIFARLSMRDSKPRYLGHVPRVWRYLQRNFVHPELRVLSEAVNSGIPAPTTERLQRIKDLCGNVRTL
ncbi:MAG: phosphotransferase [Albidovulum sp.]